MHCVFKEETMREVHSIAKNMPVDVKLLEIGAGTGRLFIPVIKEARPSLAVALDINLDFLLKLKRRLKVEGLSRHSDVVLGSVCYLPYRSDTFDVVTLAHVLMYICNYEYALEEARRVAIRKIIDISPYVVSIYAFLSPIIHFLKLLLNRRSYLHYFWPWEIKPVLSRCGNRVKQEPLYLVPSRIFSIQLPYLAIRILRKYDYVAKRALSEFYAYRVTIAELAKMSEMTESF
jgi:ubiquinone/menaquinone biosynthesis C-methylase UbiE